MPFKVRILLVFLVGAFSCALANESKVVDLDPYTVTSSRLDLELGKVGSSLTLITQDQIESLSAPLATEALRYVPGLFLRNNGSVGSVLGMSVRGLPIPPLVLIDGVEVSQPATGFVYNFGNLPSNMIESIEVLRGGQSALYGGNAITGVIQVNTINPQHGESQGLISAYGGSRNTFGMHGSYAVAQNRSTFLVSVSAYDTDGHSVQPEFASQWADDDLHRSNSLILKYGFDFSDSMSLSTFLLLTDSKVEYDPGVPPAPDPEDWPFWFNPIEDNFLESEQLTGKVSLEGEWSEQFETEFSVQFNSYEDLAQDAFGTRISDSSSLKLDAINEISISENLTGVWGLEWERVSDDDNDFEMDTTAIFMEQVWHLNDNTNLTFGGRFDDNEIYGTETTWRASASLDYPEYGVRVKSSFGTAFDAPEVSQLFGPFGNPSLKPESGYHLDLGFETISANQTFIWGATFFQTEIEDRIEFLRSTFSFANVDWRSVGVETHLKVVLTEDLNVTLNYTWSDAERRRVADSLIFHSPKNLFSVVLNASLTDSLETTLSGYYVDEQESFDGPTDSFYVINFSSRYRFDDTYLAWVRIDNLLNHGYQEILNFNAPGIGIFAGFEVEF